ncbi:MarR family transcriptional regulator [Arthrobacter crystallopoietes BAB-32]|uniref:MarR family transcriptional regulator n=1 Tax=Arthrobacter crystallopoietes BAB-32 TaxID=1246476 RepID=N1UWP2_9MICC|nr:MarR family winged helix-turn-helix transcriptional regulator [Arthrobacter crystallopoietes]EMY33490.1 MarR family transcriptional regulator [Arthrobacter crystallopoietes BAB-32]
MAEENLLDAFWAVARALRGRSRNMLAPLGISPWQSRALGELDRHGPMRLGILSERLRIAARSATEVVDGLEALGLVVRQPDPQDRRATVVSLTSEGKQRRKDIRSAQLAEAEHYFGVLSPEEQACLAQSLRKLHAGGNSSEA